MGSGVLCVVFCFRLLFYLFEFLFLGRHSFGLPFFLGSRFLDCHPFGKSPGGNIIYGKSLFWIAIFLGSHPFELSSFWEVIGWDCHFWGGHVLDCDIFGKSQFGFFLSGKSLVWGARLL